MNILDIITRKKNGLSLSYDELKYAFNEYLNGNIPDYQMSSLLMAITIKGMNLSETLSLTDIFIRSGEAYDLSQIMPYTVDKHSTGGVGDTTTLIIVPMCAALGLHMAKMSGRGLGLTGGTIDKLESIPGFNVNLTEEQFYGQVAKLGFAISSQTKNLVPMDKAIYSLRDVTGTTESIPLIASSIMSKKIAAGAENILIDIKVGSGALIKTQEDAKKLSDTLIEIGDAYKKNVRTIISDMNTPLSNAIGNSIEVVEAINVLHGKKCKLYDTCIEIVAILLSMAKEIPVPEAEIMAEEVIRNGEALKKFYEFVSSQGGRLSELNVAQTTVKVHSKHAGTIESIDALGAAKLASKIGTSKKTLDDEIDYQVGIMLNKNIGDHVNLGDELMTLYINDKSIKFKNEDFNFIKITKE
jgi:pyrimidine-nucleoside phosphorylase